MPGNRTGAAPCAPRGGRRPLQGGTSSVSPPVRAPPGPTSTEASSLLDINQQRQQRREAQLRNALEHTNPSPAEVSTVASAAYVQSLMDMIRQHEASVRSITRRVDDLQEQREKRWKEAETELGRCEMELQRLRNTRSDLTLQVQEERERATRLLYENTTLYAQQAEQQEQIHKLVELCRVRGKRLGALAKQKRSNTRDSGASACVARKTEVLDALTGEIHEGGCSATSSSHLKSDAKEEEEGSDLELNMCLGAVRERNSNSNVMKPVEVTRVASSVTAPSPPSLSIHRASERQTVPAATQGTVTAVASSASLRLAPSYSSQTPQLYGTSATLDGVGDDAEVAALLNVPYKTQLPGASSSSAPHTITANAATTTHMLALHEEVHMLRQLLEEQRATYEQARDLQRREHDEVHRRHVEQQTKYCTAMTQLEMLHEESIRELVQYRHQAEKTIRDVRGQVEWLRGALQEALSLAVSDRRRQHNEVHATEQRVSRQYVPKVQSLRAELEECRKGFVVQAREHAAALAQRDDRVAELQQRLKAEVAQRRRAEERYKLEREGVHSELDLMRQSLREMERRVYYRNFRDEASDDARTEWGELASYYC